MDLVCLHCSSAYDKSSDIEGFCCVGCQTVYSLIQNEGLGEYYQMQDRVADPIKDRASSNLDDNLLSQVQADLELSGSPVRAIFSISGMSCMGCVWLVQRLARGQASVVHAEVSLSSQQLSVEWVVGEFDLKALAIEVQRFGYHLEPSPLKGRRSPSSLSVRSGLCAIFTLNSAFLWAYQYATGDSKGLAQLLSLACLVFTFILGTVPFYLSAFRAFKIGRFHSDWIPASILSVLVLLAGYLLLLDEVKLSAATLSLSSLITVFILARWLAALISRRWG